MPLHLVRWTVGDIRAVCRGRFVVDGTRLWILRRDERADEQRDEQSERCFHTILFAHPVKR
jgi:hypothetical protein